MPGPGFALGLSGSCWSSRQGAGVLGPICGSSVWPCSPHLAWQTAERLRAGFSVELAVDDLGDKASDTPQPTARCDQALQKIGSWFDGGSGWREEGWRFPAALKGGVWWIKVRPDHCVAKGRLQKPVVDLLEQIGIDCSDWWSPPKTHHPCPRYRVEVSPGKTGIYICGVRSCGFGSCGEDDSWKAIRMWLSLD